MDPYYLTLGLYIFMIYWFVILILNKKGILERYNISAFGPLLMIRTKRGKNLLEKLARGEQRKRFWRTYADLGTIFVLISMIFMFILIVYSIYLIFTVQPEPTELHAPRNWLLIPGLNEFIPLLYGVIGLVVALVVHELSHAVLSTVEGIKVKSMGLLVALVPIGAFAEPDSEQLFGEKQSTKAKTRGIEKEKETVDEKELKAEGEKKKVATARERTRILSAGVTSNFVVALIAFLVFFSLISAIQPVIDNVPFVYMVANDSPADKAGIEPGMMITEVDGSMMNVDAYNKQIEEKINEGLILTALDKKGKEREIIVEGGYESERVWIAWAEEGLPADNAGIKAGMSILKINDVHINDYDDFLNFMNHTVPEQVIEVQTNDKLFHVELEKSPRDYETGYLGVVVTNNALGMLVEKFSAKEYLKNLQSIPTSFTTLSPRLWLRSWLTLLAMPIIALPSGGFCTTNSFLAHLYEPVGALSFLGDNIFSAAGVFFWIGWVNLMLGLFNCLPMIPLDGGYVFREILNPLLRIGIKEEKKREKIAKTIVAFAAIFIFSCIVILLAGPHLLPVIGVLWLIAVMVLLVAVCAALAYVLSRSAKTPSAVLVVEGANANSDTLKIIHQGGDTIIDAFGNPATGGVRGQFAGDWNYLEVRQNGELCTLSGKSTLNGDDWWNPGPNKYTRFAAGDELKITGLTLNAGDSIVILYTQTGDILQRTTVT